MRFSRSVHRTGFANEKTPAQGMRLLKLVGHAVTGVAVFVATRGATWTGAVLIMTEDK
jgi:hypothetical protein